MPTPNGHGGGGDQENRAFRGFGSQMQTHDRELPVDIGAARRRCRTSADCLSSHAGLHHDTGRQGRAERRKGAVGRRRKRTGARCIVCVLCRDPPHIVPDSENLSARWVAGTATARSSKSQRGAAGGRAGTASRPDLVIVRQRAPSNERRRKVRRPFRRWRRRRARRRSPGRWRRPRRRGSPMSGGSSRGPRSS